MQRDFHQTKEELIYTENEPGSVELLKGAGIIFSGRLVGRGLGFLSHFLFARLLGPTHYGVFLLSTALFNFAGLLADLGLRSGVLRESAAAEGRGDHKMVRETILGGAALAVGASLLAAGALLVMRGWVASFFKAPDLGWLLPLFALSLPFATFVFHMTSFSRSTLRSLNEHAGFVPLSIKNSKPTQGDPYLGLGSKGQLLLTLIKLTAHGLAQSAYLISGGRWLIGPSLEAWGRRVKNPQTAKG